MFKQFLKNKSSLFWIILAFTANLIHASEMEILGLEIDGLDTGLQPSFSSEIRHYSAPCGSGDVFSLKVNAGNNRSVYMNGTKTGAGLIRKQIWGLTHKDDIRITVKENENYGDYFIHCVSKDFPKINVLTKTSKVDDGFLLLTTTLGKKKRAKSYMLIVDNNGVPRYREVIPGKVADFKRHWNGKYSYALKTQWNEYDHQDAEIVLLDEYLNEETRLKTIGLNQTDNHDFLITQDDTFILMSYNSIYRDMRPWGLSKTELTRDSIVQEQTHDGEVIFEWNSWDHVDLNGCLNHRFPDDYAHINSMYESDDRNLILSLRGCSMVLKIDRINKTGKVIWSLGGANPTMKLTGDPFGEFCGQHTAGLNQSNNLILFDNGDHCNGNRNVKYGKVSRAVEYLLNFDQKEAQYKKSLNFQSSKGSYAKSGGSFSITRNRNWLINWGSGLYDIVEYTPDAEEALKMTIVHNEEKQRTYRVYRVYDVSLPLRLGKQVTYQKFQN